MNPSDQPTPVYVQQPHHQPNSGMTNTFAHERSYDPNISIYETAMTSLGNLLGMFGAIPICCCFPNPYRSVEQGNVGLITRFGRYLKTTDPGLTWVNPVTESLATVDVKIQVINIADVAIMTKDNVNITIDCVLYWHVVDPYQASFGVANVYAALMERAQTTIRAVLGQRCLQDCIENRGEIAQEVEISISAPATSWGVKVESVLIKDLAFSRELSESLSSAAQAKRIGESRVIAAQAEVDSAKLMREAADILNSPAAIQIRYLETMQQMSRTSGSKVIFMPFNAGGIDHRNILDQPAIKDIANATLLSQIADS
ncbi:hypothetical protein DSO57_1029995 [Entomophthora muscae]|uniref:Uncharacterized protein n=1 Tax=Entomophthora muscae TaxID=34485 RepID=A0ACC2S349_9FUNG|nr:hypothetical protein DSO57_1029995 [Entomophthora muscae]